MPLLALKMKGPQSFSRKELNSASSLNELRSGFLPT